MTTSLPHRGACLDTTVPCNETRRKPDNSYHHDDYTVDRSSSAQSELRASDEEDGNQNALSGAGFQVVGPGQLSVNGNVYIGTPTPEPKPETPEVKPQVIAGKHMLGVSCCQLSCDLRFTDAF